jgi:hypothetical protein
MVNAFTGIMGYDYYIACKDCRNFINLGRWRIFCDLKFPVGSAVVFPGAGNVASVPISGSLLREYLEKRNGPFSLNKKDEPRFDKLVQLLTAFYTKHNEHEIYFINDSGDFPWAICDQYPWYEWSEIISPNTVIERFALPKNLVCDLHLESWKEIEKHLLKLHRYNPKDFPGEIERVKFGFEKFQTAKNTA